MDMTHNRLMTLSAVPTASATALYTNLSSTVTYVGTIVLHNTNPASSTVTLYYVPTGGAANTTTQLIKIPVSTNETVIFDLKYPIVLSDTNDAIYAIASVSGVNLICNGSIFA